jgi:hypothetical protein
MNYPSSLAGVGACLLLAMAGIHAHARQAQAAAADPQAAVPATRYQSVLAPKPEAAPETSPDRNWVAGNQTVAATNSMSLTMKAMGGQAARAGHAGHGEAAPADRHADHMQHGMQHDMKTDRETP